MKVPFDLDKASDPLVESMLLRTKKGAPRRSRTNLHTILKNDPVFKNKLAYDAFEHAISYDGAPIDDVFDNAVALWLDRAYDLGVNVGLIGQVIDVAARERIVHQVRDWLDTLVWDGRHRLASLFRRGFGADGSELNEEISLRWAISAVARVMAPGCKVDTVTVLVGAQGCGKSSGLQALVPSPDWVSDTPIDINNKDGLQALCGVWILELAELEGIQRQPPTRVKSFITSAVDRFRPPFGRKPSRFPRQCVLVGTTNDDTFLSDTTGSRRFWVVEVGSVDREWIINTRDQLWAEAVHLYRSGTPWHLSPEMDAERAARNAVYEYEDPWAFRIDRWLEGQARSRLFGLAEAMSEALDLPPQTAGKRQGRRVSAILRARGFQSQRVRDGSGRQRRVWVRPIPVRDPVQDPGESARTLGECGPGQHRRVSDPQGVSP